MANIAEICPEVDSVLTSISKLVSDPGVIASVKRLDAITANVEATTNSLNKSVKSLPVLMSGVNSTVDNVNRLTGNLAEVSEDLKSCPLDSTLQNIQQTTENLRMLTQELNNPNSTLGLLMKDPELYNNLNNTVKSLDSLFVDIKKSPKRYINIKLL